MFMTEPCKQLTLDEFNFYQNALLIISTFNPMSERYHIHYTTFFFVGDKRIMQGFYASIFCVLEMLKPIDNNL